MQPYQTILVAVDFSDHSDLALQRAQQLAALYQADLKVVHIAEVPSFPVLEDIAVTGLPAIWDDEVKGKVEQVGMARLKKMAQQVGIDEASCHLVVGVPRYEIVEYAEQLGADLIVLGRRGLSGIQALIGSTADSVLHHAKCDVLAVNLEKKT